MKTLSYYLGQDKEIKIGESYYFGQIWNGNGNSEEFLEDGCVAIYDEEIEDDRIIAFEILDNEINEEHISETFVKVTDIY